MALVNDPALQPPLEAPKPKHRPPPKYPKPGKASQAEMARYRLFGQGKKEEKARQPKDFGIAAGTIRSRTSKLRASLVKERARGVEVSSMVVASEGTVAEMIERFREVVEIREEVVEEIERQEARQPAPEVVQLVANMQAVDGALQNIPELALSAEKDDELPMDKAVQLVDQMDRLLDVLVCAVRSLQLVQIEVLDPSVGELLDAIFRRFGQAFTAFCESALNALASIQVTMEELAGFNPEGQAQKELHILNMVIEFSKMTSIHDDVARRLRPKAEELKSYDQGLPALDQFMGRVVEFVEWGQTAVQTI